MTSAYIYKEIYGTLWAAVLIKKEKIIWTAMVTIQGQLNTTFNQTKINGKMLFLAGNLTKQVPSPSYPICRILLDSCEISSVLKAGWDWLVQQVNCELISVHPRNPFFQMN
jgi:hypothetical protein